MTERRGDWSVDVRNVNFPHVFSLLKSIEKALILH